MGRERAYDVRMRILLTAALAALGALLLALPVGAAAKATPNPCKVVPAPFIAKALQASALGKLSTQSAGAAGKEEVCTYQRGATKLMIDIGSAAIASQGFGGPPGMVVAKNASLGPKGMVAYDTNPKYTFANVSFVKGAYYGSVWSNKLSAATVIGLAKHFYAGLP